MVVSLSVYVRLEKDLQTSQTGTVAGVLYLCAHGHLSIAFAMEVVILVLPIVVRQLVHTALLLRTIACSMQWSWMC